MAIRMERSGTVATIGCPYRTWHARALYAL